MTNFAKMLASRKISQNKLSKLANVSQSNLSIYCNKQNALESSSLITRMRIANALGLSLADFEKELGIQPSAIIATQKQKSGYTPEEEKVVREVELKNEQKYKNDSNIRLS